MGGWSSEVLAQPFVMLFHYERSENFWKAKLERDFGSEILTSLNLGSGQYRRRSFGLEGNETGYKYLYLDLLTEPKIWARLERGSDLVLAILIYDSSFPALMSRLETNIVARGDYVATILASTEPDQAYHELVEYPGLIAFLAQALSKDRFKRLLTQAADNGQVALIERLLQDHPDRMPWLIELQVEFPELELSGE